MNFENRNVVIVNVDLQPDFFPGGALGAKGADKIIPNANKLNAFGRQKCWEIIMTKEDHPAHMTTHFDKYGPHCVKGTIQAAIDPRIDTTDAHIFIKGVEADQDYLTSILAKDQNGVTLKDYLLSLDPSTIVIVIGLLLEYCAGDTGIDVVAETGLETYLVSDLTPALNLHQGDDEKAIKKLQAKGVRITTLDQILK